MKNLAKFGFKMIDACLKTEKIKQLFDGVSSKYDLMNDVMSVGIHRWWKRMFMHHVNLYRNGIILDCACGTGDITRLMLKNEPSLCISSCDMSEKMLELCEMKCIEANFFQNVDFVCTAAEDLPFEANYFDCYTVVFGIRNFTNMKKSLQEAYRVLKPGGQFACLEFAHVENKFLEKFYDFYLMNVLPILGDWIADDKDSYQYLAESIKTFPKQDEFAQMIENIEFQGVKHVNLSNGIVAIHKGFK